MDFISELKLRNFSINECSKKTGIPYGALYPIIHGKIQLERCQYNTLVKLADFFNCDVTDLFEDICDFSVYWKNEKTADVQVLKNEVLVNKYSDNPVKQIFSKNILTRYELGEILKWRCWDSNRENIEKYLYGLGLTDFNPYKICRLTHGVMFQDKIWFKFADEQITWEDVKCN